VFREDREEEKPEIDRKGKRKEKFARKRPDRDLEKRIKLPQKGRRNNKPSFEEVD